MFSAFFLIDELNDERKEHVFLSTRRVEMTDRYTLNMSVIDEVHSSHILLQSIGGAR